MNNIKAIIHIIPTLAPGGAERIVTDLCSEIAKSNSITLIKLSGRTGKYNFYKSELNDNVNFIDLKGRVGKIFEFVLLFKLIKIVIQLKPKIIHSHLNITYSILLSLIFTKIDFYHTIHNEAKKECISLKGVSLKPVIGYIYRKRRIIPITISNVSDESFKLFYGNYYRIMIPNGAKMPAKSIDYHNVSEEIRKLKRTDDTIVFINIGRFSKQKNHHLLVESFNNLLTNNYDIILLIIGDGFDTRGGVELKSKSNRNIHFLGVKNNIGDYLRNSNAFCLSSIHEGAPISLLEAISCGCTPVCTPVGGITNVITHKVTGFLSKDTTFESYLATLKDFLLNRKLVKKEDLIRLFNNNYSINICAQKHLKVYGV